MARNPKTLFVNIDEISDVARNADMVKNNTNDSANNNTGNNVSDIAKLVDIKKPSYTDTRSRFTPYINTEVLNEFNEICGGRKGLKSEIVEKLLIQFIADVKNKL